MLRLMRMCVWNSMRVWISYWSFWQKLISIRVIKYHVNTTRNEVVPTHVHQNIGSFWNSAEMKLHVNRTCFHVRPWSILFWTEADRRNGIIMSLLLLVAETVKLFYGTLFQRPSQKYSADDVNHFLNTLDISKLSTDQITRFNIELTEKDLYGSMKSMENDKSPGNDGLAKGFYVTFRDDIKETFISSLKQAKERK